MANPQCHPQPEYVTVNKKPSIFKQHKIREETNLGFDRNSDRLTDAPAKTVDPILQNILGYSIVFVSMNRVVDYAT